MAIEGKGSGVPEGMGWPQGEKTESLIQDINSLVWSLTSKEDIHSLVSSLTNNEVRETVSRKVEEIVTRVQNAIKNKEIRDVLGKEISAPMYTLRNYLNGRGYNPLAAKVENVMKLMRTDIESELDQWVLEGTPDENRATAKQQLIEFMNRDVDVLFLDNLGLRSLPHVISYPIFSNKIRVLNIENNEFTTLPMEISKLHKLKKLIAARNELTTFPKEICQLPALELLNLIENHLTELPIEIGQLRALNGLYLNSNQLTMLPAEIGQLTELETLFIMRNRLIQLPTNIGTCNSLRYLNLSDNDLIALPAEIGQLSKLQDLYLSHNPALAGIPLEMLNLNQRCTIDISSGTSFSQAVLDNLWAIATAPGYTGPRFCYSMVHTVPRETEEKSIEESLTRLYTMADKPYEKLGNIPGADIKGPALRAWLSRLSYMSDYRASPEIRQWLATNILEYLKLADSDQEFRQVFSAIIDGASETCGDRVALSVVHLGIAHKLATIDLSNMQELAHFLVRGVFAMSLLEDVARNKIPALPFFDEIEVYLGYPVMLKEKLQLPIDIQGMLFFTCSALKQQDLDDAASFVLKKLENETTCLDFLITHDKWRKALSLNYPEEYAAIENERSQGLETTSTPEQLDKLQTKFKQALVELTHLALKKST